MMDEEPEEPLEFINDGDDKKDQEIGSEPERSMDLDEGAEEFEAEDDHVGNEEFDLEGTPELVEATTPVN